MKDLEQKRESSRASRASRASRDTWPPAWLSGGAGGRPAGAWDDAEYHRLRWEGNEELCAILPPERHGDPRIVRCVRRMDEAADRRDWPAFADWVRRCLEVARRIRAEGDTR